MPGTRRISSHVERRRCPPTTPAPHRLLARRHPPDDTGRHIDERAAGRASDPKVVRELTGMDAHVIVGWINIALPVDEDVGTVPIIGNGIDAAGESSRRRPGLTPIQYPQTGRSGDEE